MSQGRHGLTIGVGELRRTRCSVVWEFLPSLSTLKLNRPEGRAVRAFGIIDTTLTLLGIVSCWHGIGVKILPSFLASDPGVRLRTRQRRVPRRSPANFVQRPSTQVLLPSLLSVKFS